MRAESPARAGRSMLFGITAPLVALTVPFVPARAHTLLQVVAGTLLALGTTLLYFRIFHAS
jgi:membrane-associated phospholipid phosphatase